MDALNQVAGAGRDLLARVDAALLAAGAPADAPIWPLLRRTGALPGEALEFVLSLNPEPMRSAGAELRGRAAEFAEQRAELDERVGAAPGDAGAAPGDAGSVPGGAGSGPGGVGSGPGGVGPGPGGA